MPTPVSGSISFQDLFNEFRGSSVGAVHAISMADVYNNANLSVGTVGSPQSVTVPGNIIIQSENFGAARWTKSNVTVQVDQEVAPDGATTADRLTNGGSGTYVTQLDLETIQPGTTYNHSVYVKGFGSSVGAVVAIGNFDNGARVGATSITLTANWQRMFASFVGTATSSRDIFIQLNGTAGAGAVANLATNQSVFAWGYQITTGSALQAYVRTGTAIVPQTINTITVFTNTSVAALGAISMSQFYGVTKPSGRVTITITVPSATFTSNLDLYKLALGRGYTTGTTDVVLNIGTGAIVGSAGSSITESFSVSYTSTSVGFARRGNIVANSRNMTDGAFWQNGGSATFTTSIPASYGTILSPDQSTTGVMLATVTTVTGNNYFQQTQPNLAAGGNTYTVSAWVKGWGSSIGQRISIGAGFAQTGITLTAQWQRISWFGTNGSINRPLFYLNGGSATNNYTNNMLLDNQSVFVYGMQATSSTGAGINNQYVETTSAIGVAGVGAIQPYDVYTTSETLVTSYAVYVPSRFNSADTVRIVNNGTIVGESGKGGMGGGVVAAPAAGYPTPTAGKVGGRGGDALGIFRPVTIDNIGTIAGGGGGGGGGASGPGTTPKGGATTYTAGMGGGGAGADSNPGFVSPSAGLPNGIPAAGAPSYTVSPTVTFTAGTGGIRSIGATSTATPGANGGAIGTTGSTSTASPTNPGAAGGAPGHYVVGSPLVTWVTTGTRSGSVG